MEWGLPNQQISNQYEAFAYKLDWGSGILGAIGNLIASVIDGQIENKPKYDFYNNSSEAQNGGTPRPYMGKTFSNEITEKLILTNDKRGRLLLTECPASAVEYCYHKNKRSTNGDIIVANGSSYNESSVKWYMPSIDELEEIVLSGYGEFDVFQDKYYWSSQPSYKPVDWTAHVRVIINIGVNGQFFYDDITRARATKVDIVNNIPEYVSSGAYNAEETLNLDNTPPTPASTGKKMIFDSGNRPRTKELAKIGEDPNIAINRVRCVYRSGLVSDL